MHESTSSHHYYTTCTLWKEMFVRSSVSNFISIANGLCIVYGRSVHVLCIIHVHRSTHCIHESTSPIHAQIYPLYA